MEVSAVDYKALSAEKGGRSSAELRTEVENARAIQSLRFSSGGQTNARMTEKELRTHCVLDEQASLLLKDIVDRMGFSARGYTKVLKVARTIADLEGVQSIQLGHVTEAVQYRTLDRMVL